MVTKATIAMSVLARACMATSSLVGSRQISRAYTEITRRSVDRKRSGRRRPGRGAHRRVVSRETLMAISRRSFLASAAAAAAARHASAGSVLQPAPVEQRGEFDPWLEIDAAALAHNVTTLARLSGGRPIFAVVKNNAYGCGITTVGPILDRLPGVAGLAAVRP